MYDSTNAIKNYVWKRISKWEHSSNDSAVRAELANLRRGIGKVPGELPEIWNLLFEELPEELMSKTGDPTKAEWAIYLTLTMYALHRQGSEANDNSAYQKDLSLGKAVGILAEKNELDTVRRRFNIFATSASIEECAHYLRGIIQMLRSNKISLDYPALAADLYQYQWTDGAAKVRLHWGQDFYRVLS